MGPFRQDVAHAVRRLRRRPVFTLVAAATLAVGIGGAVAIFSVAHAVVLRPLPYAEPDRLALVWQSDRERGAAVRRDVLPRPSATGARATRPSRTWPGCRARTRAGRLSGRGEPVELAGRLVTVELLLRARRASGARPHARCPRTIARGAARVVVLSDALWRERFASDPGIVGASIVLDARAVHGRGRDAEGLRLSRGRRAVDTARARRERARRAARRLVDECRSAGSSPACRSRRRDATWRPTRRATTARSTRRRASRRS